MNIRRITQLIISIVLFAGFAELLFIVRSLGTGNLERNWAVSLGMDIFGLIVCTVLYLACASDKYYGEDINILFSALLLTVYVAFITDAISWVLMGNPDQNSLAYLVNNVHYACGIVSITLFRFYECRVIGSVSDFDESLNKIFIIFSTVAIIILIAGGRSGLFFEIDAQGFYHRTPTYFVSFIYPAFGWVACLLTAIFKKIPVKKKLSLMSYILLPGAALAFTATFYGVSVIYVACLCALIISYSNIFSERGREILRKEKALADARVDTMISQIQPHFVFNSLSAISYMCEKDAATAKEAVDKFSAYLRTNLNTATTDKLIPFETELEHIKTYVWLEKLRFGDKLNVEYDTPVSDFRVPALSIQPIVENAVKHGVCRKPSGGTVRIFTERDKDNITVTVTDTGMGFDVNAVNDDGQVHIGLNNVRERIRDISGGKVIIDSIIGQGTIVRIIIPNERKKKEKKEKKEKKNEE